jgi:hypothetical protein
MDKKKTPMAWLQEKTAEAQQRQAEKQTNQENKPAPQAQKEKGALPGFPVDTRPASNALVRSALFSAIRGKDRQWLKNDEIASVDGWTVRFTGEQLNQDDKDTLMQLTFMLQMQWHGQLMSFSGNDILRGLGRGTSGREHDALEREIKRMVEGTLTLDGPDLTFYGHILEGAMRDKESNHWHVLVGPFFSTLFSPDTYSLVDWENRKRLKNKYLARWLQLEFATHAAPYARSVEWYREQSGSRTKDLSRFRTALRRALDDLVENGGLVSWSIDAADLVRVNRTPSPTQRRHIAKRLPKD